MASWRPLAGVGSRLTVLLIVTAPLAGSATGPGPSTVGALAPAAPTTSSWATAPPAEQAYPAAAALAIPAALTPVGLDLRAGPVAVPLELHLPSLSVRAPVVGVGITPQNVMDAPMGPADDPVWQQAFWYRGSAIPGAASTALIAGHVIDAVGRPAIFADLGALGPGDSVVVHDTRDGLDVRFAVTESTTYSLDEATDPAVLTRIYGAGPVAGTDPQASADGLSHLTLITCTGTFRNGTHDHRLVVYATRVP